MNSSWTSRTSGRSTRNRARDTPRLGHATTAVTVTRDGWKVVQAGAELPDFRRTPRHEAAPRTRP
ncbi:hypothetical protein, partial [Streptomyces sp. NPDC001076]